MHKEILDSVERMIDHCKQRTACYQKVKRMTMDEFSEILLLKIILKSENFTNLVKLICHKENYIINGSINYSTPVIQFPLIEEKEQKFEKRKILELCKKIEESTAKVLNEVLNDNPPILVYIIVFDYLNEVLRDYQGICNNNMLQYA